MPNHVSHKLYFDAGEDGYRAETDALKKLQDLVKRGEHSFDFDALIPYPERFAALDKAAQEAEKAGVPWKDIPKDGFNSGGYEWRVQNWGTKWGAYDVAWGYNSVTFCTAWNTAWPVWEVLAQHFKGIEMIIKYADEDAGRNCGIVAYKDGKKLYHIQEGVMRDPELFARALIYEQRADDYYALLDEARDRIAELEKRIKELEELQATEKPNEATSNADSS